MGENQTGTMPWMLINTHTRPLSVPGFIFSIGMRLRKLLSEVSDLIMEKMNMMMTIEVMEKIPEMIGFDDSKV